VSAAAHEQLERLSALLPRVASVRTAADLDAVLPAVAEAAYEASGAACVAVFLRSRDAAGMEPVACHGPAHLRRELAAARPPAGGDGATWVALTDKDGTPLGYLGASGLPDGASGVLAAVAAYGAQALRRARASIAATRHRDALEALMRLRAEFDVRRGIDLLLANVVDAIRATLGCRTVVIRLGQDAGDGPEAATVIPLHEGDRRLGVLVAADGPDTSDPEALAILRLFAASAATRILATEAHEAAERLAGTDALTGLGNRGRFVGCVERALRDAAGDIAILLCDMDGLKALNDAEGHAAGDARLRLTADVLAGACADGESAHRLGGDEFAVLVPAGGAERAAHLAGEIDDTLRAAGAGASIGWAAGRAHATIDELLDRADAGMYRVKRGRRARGASR
jgi:diguanylate cyclase (GGDEF)-like protein